VADSPSHTSKEDSAENAAETEPLLWAEEAAIDDGSDLEALSSLVQDEAMLPPWCDFHNHNHDSSSACLNETLACFVLARKTINAIKNIPEYVFCVSPQGSCTAFSPFCTLVSERLVVHSSRFS
jgi:hypothetical protein